MRISRAFLLLVLVAGTAPSVDAQARPHRRDALSVRMDAFLAALQEYPPDTLRPFLPRRGPVTLVLANRAAGADRVGLWRFGREDLLAAMEDPGRLCEAFLPAHAMILATLTFTAIEHPRGWRRVAGTRFVPPGASARSAVFVEWRREGGRWVVSAVGDERQSRPRLLGREANSVVPDTAAGLAPPAIEPLVAAGSRWYEEHLPIVVDGDALTRYGLPRAIEPELLERIGTLHGVAVYDEAGSGTPVEVAYVPTAPGMYQPYQNMIGDGCR